MNETGLHIHISDPSVITTICDVLVTRMDQRIVIQTSRNEILTSSIQREMSRPDYTGESSFLSPLVKRLLRAYDFRDLRDIHRSISEKAVYNEAVSVWNELNELKEFKG